MKGWANTICLIAHRPVTVKGTGKRRRVRGANIPNVTMDYARKHNADGFGIAWRNSKEGGQLWYAKYGPNDGKAFDARLKEIDADTTQEYVAHWRFATHGPACLQLAHPFRYEDATEGSVLIFHNGVISAAKPTREESDTEVFVRDILAKLPSAWWRNDGILALLDDYIGWSRLTIMTKKEVVTINETDGTWDGGLWYSSSYKPYVYPEVTSSGKGETQDWTNYRSKGVADFENEWGSMRGNVWYPSDKSRFLDDDYDDEWQGVTVGGVVVKNDLKPLWETPVVGTKDGNWYHAGHIIIPLEQDRAEGYHEDKALCDICHTVGDFYVMGKSVHIDIAHYADKLPSAGEMKTVTSLITGEQLPVLIGDTNLG